MQTSLTTWLRRKDREHTVTFMLLFIGAAVGLLASFVLSVEALVLAKNSQTVLSCSVNAVLNCAAVANDPSASVLGFPNAFIGMMTLPVMLSIAVAGLGGVKFPKWFMALAEIGAIGGFVFAVWMFFTSYNVIQVLCPWCLTVDVSMLLILFALTRYTIRENTFNMHGKIQKHLEYFTQKNFDILTIVLMFFVAALLIITKFGDGLFA